MKTFIVEDSPLILEKLVATLEELAPVQVVGTASDEAGARAWLAAPHDDVGLLIIDIFLRSGSGLGVLRAAQQLATPAKRVVLTNYASPDMRATCRALGADRVFDKSSELDELLAYCEQLERGEPGGPAALA